MLRDISRGRLAAFWIAGFAVATASGIALGSVPSLTTAALLVVASVAPPLVMLLVWRGAPPPTVAELLYAVNAKDAR